MTDIEFIAHALSLTLDDGIDPPIGAIVTDENSNIIGSAANTRQAEISAVAHAEVKAIEMACKALNSWHLVGCTIYVTLEPCPMCMGAIINSRIDRVVFGAYNPKAGCCGSIVNLAELPFNHKPQVVGGVMAEECGAVLTEFFKKRRENG
jgi:Cytosine/adenosine deaminases